MSWAALCTSDTSHAHLLITNSFFSCHLLWAELQHVHLFFFDTPKGTNQVSLEGNKPGKDREISKYQAIGSVWTMSGNSFFLAKRSADTVILVNGFCDPTELSPLRQDDILSTCRFSWHKLHLITVLYLNISVSTTWWFKVNLPASVPDVHMQRTQKPPL